MPIPPPPALSDDPLPDAVAALLRRRGLSMPALGGLLRAEGLTIGVTRLHQIVHGKGALATPEQMERLAAVLGVSPSHFAEYRLWRARSLLDPSVVGFDRAMANFARLQGRAPALADEAPARATAAGERRYPPLAPQPQERP